MTQARLDDLKQTLQRYGWELLNPSERYEITRDLICWELQRNRTGVLIQLHFHVIGDLGQTGSSLAEIVWCKEEPAGSTLDFVKRSSPTWLGDVERFVQGLGQSASKEL